MDVLETDVTSESSPEPQQPATADAGEPNNDVETFSQAERDEWVKTGKVPTKSAGANGASANRTSQPGAPNAESSQVSTGEQSRDSTEYKAKTEARFNELLERNRQQAAELTALRAKVSGTSVQRQESRPEPVQTPAVEDKEPVEPNQDDFADWDDYHKAERAYQRDMARWEARQLLASEKQANTARAEQLFRESQQQQYARKLGEIEQATRKEYPDYDAISAIAEQAIRAAPSRAVVEYVTDETNPNAAKVMYALGKDPAKVAEIAALSYPRAVAALAKIEESLNGQHSSQAPVKQPASAPPPPTYLGGHKTAPVDEEAAAIAAGDFTRYKQIADAKERAARRR